MTLSLTKTLQAGADVQCNNHMQRRLELEQKRLYYTLKRHVRQWRSDWRRECVPDSRRSHWKRSVAECNPTSWRGCGWNEDDVVTRESTSVPFSQDSFSRRRTRWNSQRRRTTARHKINGFTGLIVGHLYVKFGYPSCIGFVVFVRKNRQTDGGKNPTPRLPSAWVTIRSSTLSYWSSRNSGFVCAKKVKSWRPLNGWEYKSKRRWLLSK